MVHARVQNRARFKAKSQERWVVMRIVARLRNLQNDERGVTALEYGIIAGVLGLALIGIFKTFGTTLSTLFVKIGGSI
jgi:pilus assembly protein Flp/PilA